MTLYLEDRFNALDFNTQFQELKQILNNARADVSFWGTRVIYINGNKDDTVSLEGTAYRLFYAALQRKEADNLLPADCIAGLDIVAKLNQLYAESDVELRTKNCFTRFLRWFFEGPQYDYSTRSRMEKLAGNLFCSFRPARFNQLFGNMPAGVRIEQHPAYWTMTLDYNEVFGRNYFWPDRIGRIFSADQIMLHPSCRIIARENFVRGLIPA